MVTAIVRDGSSDAGNRSITCVFNVTQYALTFPELQICHASAWVVSYDQMGLVLLDLADPRIVLHQPRRVAVRACGAVRAHRRCRPRGVFPCGWVVDAPNDWLYPYYGAADTVVGLASAQFSEVLARICASPMPSRPGERPTTRTRGDADKDYGRDHGAT